MSKWIVGSMMVVLVIVLTPLSGFGNESGANEAMASDVRIEGTVLDGRPLEAPGGRYLVIPNDLPPVVGATVEIRTLGIEVVTDEKGQFVIDSVAVEGPFLKVDMDVTAAGFGDWHMNDYPIRANIGANRPYVQLSSQSQIIDYPPFPAPERSNDGVGASGQQSLVLGGGCTGYFSNTTQPPTIRVYRVSLGYWDTYDFKYYVKNVLPNEWAWEDPPWHPQLLRAGAASVENYGWFWVNYRKYPDLPDGTCYDVLDTFMDQVFVPGSQGADYDAAVDAVWSSRAKESGLIFETNYWSGNEDEACGVALNGWQSRQWGTKACAEAGWSWQDIVTLYYYPDVCVTPWTQSVPDGDDDCDG